VRESPAASGVPPIPDTEWQLTGNLLARRFAVLAPNTSWVTDITYLWTPEGWLYLAVILDLFSRRVIGWSLSERLERSVALEALEMAIKHRRPASGLLHHSDRGSQYASHEYQELLEQHGIRCSMSRKANCWDNAVAESFFRHSEARTSLPDPLEHQGRCP
jgi:putative transposase